MRLLLIAASYDGTETFAGGFVHVVEVAARWTDVELVVVAPQNLARAVEADLKPHAFIPVPNFFGPSRALTWFLRAIAGTRIAWHVRHTCDVALAISHSLPDSLPLTVFGANRGIIQTWHLIGSPAKRPGGLLHNTFAYINELVGKTLAMRAKAFIVGSRLLARELGIAGQANVFVTTNGVDHVDVATMRERRGAIYVGRLHPTKSVEDLIAAWAIVHKRLPDEHLVLVGRGKKEYVERLDALIRAAGIGDVVTIRDDVDDAEKGRLLGAAKLFTFPSKEEGWGIAVGEAMAAGLPCVTYDLPVFREIFPIGRSIAPIGDVETFAEKIVDILKDPLLYDARAADALRLGATFSWERAATVERDAIAFVCGGDSTGTREHRD